MAKKKIVPPGMIASSGSMYGVMNALRLKRQKTALRQRDRLLRKALTAQLIKSHTIH